jgi:hypothetical protein
MNRGPILATVVLSVLSSGCGTFFEIAARNIVHAPLDAASDRVRDVGLCLQARATFRDICHANPDQPFSPDYADGFVAGYVDYAESGGNGEARPNPPSCYKLVCYDSPAGRQAQLDYYAGFRHGAEVARESGVRDVIVVPPGQAPAPATDPDQRLRGNPPSTGPTEPTLPLPHPEPIPPPAVGDAAGKGR